ncbi:MAG: YdiU family protein [Cytophagales bacterium]|nr:YdiU family protein [Cytophagales bacterium]
MKELNNHFATLGADFYTKLAPQGLPNPYAVCLSRTLADALGLSAQWMASNEALQVFAGNRTLQGSQPLASVYSGHQFGVWAGQLGDGRALLLGELATARGSFEIQLKGAGRTPYSRMGDGRAVLRSSIREFLCSEAMHGLGIPTTRALALVGSELLARRETNETTAVVTRVAPSFIRFGHFEHFAYRGDHAQLKQLADYVIERYYPECLANHAFAHPLAGNPYAALLAAVSSRTALMVAAWQAVGFCHGVMNTDNMSILGLTIDYGPFQFLDGFNPAHICNHSDEQGRYAYNRQPNIAYWNLFCLGQALLPLIEQVAGSGEAAQAAAIEALEPFKSEFPAALQAKMQAKLGLPDRQDGDKALIEDVLTLLAKERTDYAIFWRTLATSVAHNHFEPARDLFVDRAALDAWLIRLKDRHPNGQLMLQSNPQFVLRNHLAQTAIEKAQVKDFSEVARLLNVLETPFEEHRDSQDLAGHPPDWAAHLAISCSS